jgi:hypothetical protein
VLAQAGNFDDFVCCRFLDGPCPDCRHGAPLDRLSFERRYGGATLKSSAGRSQSHVPRGEYEGIAAPTVGGRPDRELLLEGIVATDVTQESLDLARDLITESEFA